MRHKWLSVIAAAVIGLGVAAAEAATLSLSSVEGVWSSVETNAPVRATLRRPGTPGTTGLQGIGTSDIVWGVPQTRQGKSGYSFDAAAPRDVMEDQDFDLGVFSHLNHTIANGTSIRGATLQVAIDVMLGGEARSVNLVFDFTHLETDNIPAGGARCADGGTVGRGVNDRGCADKVTVTQNEASNASFDIGNVRYSLSITGLLYQGTLLQNFWTREDARNSAVLRARWTSTLIGPPPPPSTVPLPAAGSLLLGGIAGMAVLRRRRRAA